MESRSNPSFSRCRRHRDELACPAVLRRALMRIFGLTGGIATGKSTVSAMFRALGAEVIDADELAREVVEPGTAALSEIDRRFPGMIAPDGRLDRAKLAGRIFAAPDDRTALNAIVHPRIQQAFIEKAAALARQGVSQIIYDAALLIENRLHEKMDGVILVSAPRETQIARLRERNGLTREQAEARLSSQMPLEEKARFARWIIDNSGDLAATRAKVKEIWNLIQSGPTGGSSI
jgi:dephospho-CoA kinase